jgi:hypothetical protein
MSPAPRSPRPPRFLLPPRPQLPDDPAALKELLQRQQEVTRQREARIAELELDNLRRNHRLAVALKPCYGPRADKVPGGVGQMLLEFATNLESRPVVAADLPPSDPPAGPPRPC